jgi:hypothetical protein
MPSISKTVTGSPQIAWRSACAGGECVEFARYEDTVLLRDSKDPESPVLTFRPQEIQAFFDGIKAGDLDDLL